MVRESPPFRFRLVGDYSRISDWFSEFLLRTYVIQCKGASLVIKTTTAPASAVVDTTTTTAAPATTVTATAATANATGCWCCCYFHCECFSYCCSRPRHHYSVPGRRHTHRAADGGLRCPSFNLDSPGARVEFGKVFWKDILARGFLP